AGGPRTPTRRPQRVRGPATRRCGGRGPIATHGDAPPPRLERRPAVGPSPPRTRRQHVSSRRRRCARGGGRPPPHARPDRPFAATPLVCPGPHERTPGRSRLAPSARATVHALPGWSARLATALHVGGSIDGPASARPRRHPPDLP